jgi:hypothetical protein
MYGETAETDEKLKALLSVVELARNCGTQWSAQATGRHSPTTAKFGNLGSVLVVRGL